MAATVVDVFVLAHWLDTAVLSSQYMLQRMGDGVDVPREID